MSEEKQAERITVLEEQLQAAKAEGSKIAYEFKCQVFWGVTVASTLVLLAAIIAGSTSYYYTSIQATAMEQGYTQQPLPGEQGVYCVKDEKIRE